MAMADDIEYYMFRDDWDEPFQAGKEWWDEDQVSPDDLEPWWVTQDGQSIKISDMLTSHLFNATRMLYNHAVPERYRLHPYKKYRMVVDPRMWNAMLYHLLSELSKRPLTNKELEDLRHMAHVTNQLTKGKYPPLDLQKKYSFDDL